MAESKQTSFDAAALAAASLAASLSLFTKEGPFDFFGVIIGLTLLLIIAAYEFPRTRTIPIEIIALGAVIGLGGLLVSGYFVECAAKLLNSPRGEACQEIKLPLGPKGEMVIGQLCEEDTRISDPVLVAIWLIIAAVVAVYDARHQGVSCYRLSDPRRWFTAS